MEYVPGLSLHVKFLSFDRTTEADPVTAAIKEEILIF